MASESREAVTPMRQDFQPIPSSYGSIQVSRTSPKYVWVKVTDLVDADDPKTATKDGYAHLTNDDALRLANQLLEMVSQHVRCQPEEFVMGKTGKLEPR